MGHVILREGGLVGLKGLLGGGVILLLIVDGVKIRVEVRLADAQLDNSLEAVRGFLQVAEADAPVRVVGLEVGQGQGLPEGAVIAQALLHHRPGEKLGRLGGRILDGRGADPDQGGAVPVEVSQGEVAAPAHGGALRLVQGGEEGALGL